MQRKCKKKGNAEKNGEEIAIYPGRNCISENKKVKHRGLSENIVLYNRKENLFFENTTLYIKERIVDKKK